MNAPFERKKYSNVPHATWKMENRILKRQRESNTEFFSGPTTFPKNDK